MHPDGAPRSRVNPAWKPLALWCLSWAVLWPLDDQLDLANKPLILLLASTVAALWLAPWSALATGASAVLALTLRGRLPQPMPTEPGLLQHAQALCNQMGSALEHSQALHQVTQARKAAQSQALRNTLLAAIAHDHRTPLRIGFLYAGPLFIHQFSHAWIDFRGIRDAFMRAKDSDYFENSRRATYVQREYAMRNPGSFTGCGTDCWGLSAGDGPGAKRRRSAGRRQSFYGYAARSVPYGPDDGTISGSAMLSSLVFAPELVLPALRALWSRSGGGDATLIRASGFNPTVAEAGPNGWVSPGEFGLDQGMTVLMIENHRSGLPWRLGRANPFVRAGLRRAGAGFKDGWL